MSKTEKAVVRAAMKAHALMGGAEIKSLVNGQLLITPEWPHCKPYNEEDGGGPGLFTRMNAAAYLLKIFEACARHAKAKKAKP